MMSACPFAGLRLRTAAAGCGEPAPAMTPPLATIVRQGRSCAPDGICAERALPATGPTHAEKPHDDA